MLKEGESFVYTACPGWGDHDYCALKTIVKDGKIVRTEAVDYFGPEAADGHICQKGCLPLQKALECHQRIFPHDEKQDACGDERQENCQDGCPEGAVPAFQFLREKFLHASFTPII